MLRIALGVFIGFSTLVLSPPAPGREATVAPAAAQAPKPRPRIRGSRRRLTIDSSPQRATVYWDQVTASAPGAPRDYGVAGYTPLTLTVPRGMVKLIIELPGFKPVEHQMDVRRNQKINFTMERAPQNGQLDLRPGFDNGATGAEVTIDGVSRGTIPNVFELTAGRHQVEAKKAGFDPWSQWVDIREGEHRTIDVQMKRDAIGTIMVMGEGDVFLDGVQKDAAPTLLTGVPAGEHVVELKRGGESLLREVVRVEAGKQAKVGVGGPGGPTGKLRVLANEQEVEVYLDGKLVGKAPAELENVIAGQHVVEGKKKGFKTSEQMIKLTPGEQLLVRLTMEPAPEEKPQGMLSVKSAVPGAEVFLDGASLGAAPVDRKDLEPGRHFVVVRKKGFRDFSREVILEERKPVTIIAELAAESKLKFLSNPAGAQVYIDGEPIEGITPNVREDVPAGDHQIVFRKNGFVDFKQVIKVEGGVDRIVQADLEAAREGPTPDELYKAKMGASSLGAKALPKGGFIADVGLGYPYILETRLLVSAVNREKLKLDAGILMKTYFQMWEFGLQSRVQFAKFGPLYLGGRGMLGGGAGFEGRNNFSLELGPVATLSFADRVNFSIHTYYQFYTDRLCATDAAAKSRSIERRAECFDQTNKAWKGKNPITDRFDGHRLMLGGALEVALNRYFSAWVRLDFLIVPWESRAAFRDGANSVMFENDPWVYGGAGLSLKM